ncbi:hypothetical protein BH10CHL1_BH10CHL1_18060 [soil metagenome]
MANQYGFMANAAPPKTTRDLPRGGAASYAAPVNAPTSKVGAGWNLGDVKGASTNQTQPGNGWEQGPSLTMPQGGYGYQPQGSDYQNPDGSWHDNPNYGQGGSDIGRNSPQAQTSGEGGPPQGYTGYTPAQGAPDFSSWRPSTNIGNYEDQGYRTRVGAMSSTLMPWAQFEQNNYQYGNDFAESQRRDDRNYGLTAEQQHYQQSLSDRQQSAAEQQAALAGNQWSLSYQQGLNNDKWSQGFQDKGQDIQNQQFQQNFGLQDYATREQLAQSKWGDQQKYGQSQQQIDNQNNQFNQTQAFNQLQNGQQYGLQQNQFAETQLQNQRNYGLSQQDYDLRALANGQQYEQGNTALGIQDYTAKQNAAYQQNQLAQAGLLGNRGLDIQDYQAKQQAAYQTAQLAQAKEAAYLSAYGRNQSPNAKWRFAT